MGRSSVQSRLAPAALCAAVSLASCVQVLAPGSYDIDQLIRLDTFNGVVIDVGTACGYVTGFSLTLSNIPTPAPHIRLGIYEDDHGPTNLIAQTAESQAQEQNDLQVQN